jgi:hypothetical protein
MKRIAFACVLLALAAPSAAFAQLATNQLYNFVNTPVTVTYSASGQAQVSLSTTSGAIISIAGYRKVSMRLGATHATTLQVSMGKISGPTLSAAVLNGPVDGRIHTFDVVGPELVLTLSGGPPNTTDHIQLWVYLST